MSHIPLQGILPAVVTPFDAEERFTPAAFEGLLDRLYAAGSDGVYVNGNTGEGLLQSVEQRQRVAELARTATPRDKQLVVHIGAHRTADAVALARHAAAIHADAISSLPPLGPYSFAEIRSYYQAIAAVSGVPVLVYYFPAVSPGVQTLEQILELLEIPGVVGLKFTNFDLYRLSLVKRTGCVVFNGHDEVLAAGLLMGADGGIGSFYNLVPELFVELQSLTRQQHWDDARKLQLRINELVEIGLRYPLIPAIKTILGWTGLDCGQALLPRRALSDVECADLRVRLEASSFAHLIRRP